MGRFCPNVRTVPPPPKLKRIWKKSEIAVLHKKLTYDFTVMRKNRRLEKTAKMSFILCTRTIDTMSRAMRVTYKGDKTYTYRVLMGEPDGKRPSRTPRRRSKDNIKTVTK
jgi:hypothetical protein